MNDKAKFVKVTNLLQSLRKEGTNSIGLIEKMEVQFMRTYENFHAYIFASYTVL